MRAAPRFPGFYRVIFWTYGRGTWQYDILCALILAFIFLTPKGIFDGSYFRSPQADRGDIRNLSQAPPSYGSNGESKAGAGGAGDVREKTN